MGNHEFCEDCYENDFHYGRECDPEKKAKVDAEKARIAEQKRIEKEAEDILWDRHGYRLITSSFDRLKLENEIIKLKEQLEMHRIGSVNLARYIGKTQNEQKQRTKSS